MLYVDDMYKTSMGNFRGMRMSHMVGDTVEELHEFAKRIGMKRSWFQRSPSGDHYDVSMSYRRRAVALGAHEITMRECAAICWCQRNKLFYSSPTSALKQMLYHAMLLMNGEDNVNPKAAQPVARKRSSSVGARTNVARRVSKREPPMASLPRKIPKRSLGRARPEASARKGVERRRPST